MTKSQQMVVLVKFSSSDIIKTFLHDLHIMYVVEAWVTLD